MLRAPLAFRSAGFVSAHFARLHPDHQIPMGKRRPLRRPCALQRAERALGGTVNSPSSPWPTCRCRQQFLLAAIISLIASIVAGAFMRPWARGKQGRARRGRIRPIVAPIRQHPARFWLICRPVDSVDAKAMRKILLGGLVVAVFFGSTLWVLDTFFGEISWRARR